MQATDKADFTALIAKTWRFYGKQPTGESVADWFELLEGFALDVIAVAFKRHLTDPQQGQYLPKPADIVRHLPVPKADDDGRPSADEAWGLLLRLVRDEAETGVLNDEMRTGWTACQPILDVGDEVGARRCFIETYNRAVTESRAKRLPPHWTVTLGTDPRLRKERISQAVQRGQLGREHAMALLPGLSVAALDVAGLLEGPKAQTADQTALPEGPAAPKADATTASQRLRAVAALLRQTLAAQDAQRQQAQHQRHTREADRRAKLQGQAEEYERTRARACADQGQVRLLESLTESLTDAHQQAA
ncbi:MAG: hypothetical protein WAT67_07915 [Candidatus Contendobacter sp.]